MLDNRTLRERARYQLGGGIFSNDWLLMLAVCAVWSIVSAMISNATTTESEEIELLDFVGTVLSWLVCGPFLYGICRAGTKLARGYKVELKDAVSGFQENFTGSLLLGFLVSLFTCLWTLLLIVPGIVKSYSYAMAHYLRQDDLSKEKDAIEYINESKAMMEGYKWQLFCLDLSFIGWYFVGLLCLGVGIFFVVPYHQTARANFYQELRYGFGGAGLNG